MSRCPAVFVRCGVIEALQVDSVVLSLLRSSFLTFVFERCSLYVFLHNDKVAKPFLKVLLSSLQKKKLGVHERYTNMSVICARHNRRKLSLSFPKIHFMTRNIVHDDRNGRITSYFFRFDAMISRWEKVMGLQSRRKQGPKTVLNSYSKNMVLGMEKWFNMIAVIIWVMPLIGFEYESL